MPTLVQLISTPAATDSPATAKAPRLLLRMLRAAQPVSRAELARRLNINRSTMTDTFKPLIAAGLVLEEPVPLASAGRVQGRPAVSLSFNTGRDFFVGVNIGVRRSQVGLTTLGGEILAEEDFETPAQHQEAIALVRSTIAGLCAKASPRRLRAIGVSVPGPTDSERSRLLYAPHLGWNDVALADALRFNSVGERSAAGDLVPIIIENDSTAAAMYEARLRLAETTADELDNFILVGRGWRSERRWSGRRARSGRR